MNKVFIIGNLTRDPEATQTSSGVSVCNFTVAVQRRFANAEGNREADFLPVVVWRQQAENCGKFLRKGSKVAVSGSIQTRSYDANDGSKRYVTEIVADEVEFLTPKNSGGFEDAAPSAPRAAAPKHKPVDELDVIAEDDLPF